MSGRAALTKASKANKTSSSRTPVLDYRDELRRAGYREVWAQYLLPFNGLATVSVWQRLDARSVWEFATANHVESV